MAAADTNIKATDVEQTCCIEAQTLLACPQHLLSGLLLARVSCGRQQAQQLGHGSETTLAIC